MKPFQTALITVLALLSLTHQSLAANRPLTSDQIDDPSWPGDSLVLRKQFRALRSHHEGRMSTIEADASKNKTDIATNKAGIATNKSDIATNNSAIAQNLQMINTNVGEISKNSTRIVQNESAIGVNAGKISDMKKVDEAFAVKLNSLDANDTVQTQAIEAMFHSIQALAKRVEDLENQTPTPPATTAEKARATLEDRFGVDASDNSLMAMTLIELDSVIRFLEIANAHGALNGKVEVIQFSPNSISPGFEIDSENRVLHLRTSPTWPRLIHDAVNCAKDLSLEK